MKESKSFADKNSSVTLALPTKSMPAESVSRAKSRLSSDLSLAGGRKNFAWRSNPNGGFKVPKYQNSYRLEPYLPFKFEVSDKILVKIMLEKLKNIPYSPESSAQLCRSIAKDVLDQLYKTDYDRVKYVVTMTIVENADQSMVSLNGRLWDAKRDTYSLFVYDENPTLHAAGMVFAVYYE